MRTTLFAIAVFAAALAHAQAPDSSGNSMLKGKFQFREVAVLDVDASGDPVETAAAYGAWPRGTTSTKAASRRAGRPLGARSGSDCLLVARLRFFSETGHLGAQLGHLGILDGSVGLLVIS